MLLNYFHEYAILLPPNFSVLTVDRASPLSVKRSGGGWAHHADPDDLAKKNSVTEFRYPRACRIRKYQFENR
jgi:hypothetical protein